MVLNVNASIRLVGELRRYEVKVVSYWLRPDHIVCMLSSISDMGNVASWVARGYVIIDDQYYRVERSGIKYITLSL